VSKFEVERANVAVTAAIRSAETTLQVAMKAWMRVAECEAELARLLPDGPERMIAERGVITATRKIQMIELVQHLADARNASQRPPSPSRPSLRIVRKEPGSDE